MPKHRHVLAAFVLLHAFSPLASAQDAPEIVWADRWNSIYHRFTDEDGDGEYLTSGEVSFALDPDSPASFPASNMRETIEGGQRVTYWLMEFDDLILRGVDLDGDGTLAGFEEIKIFRDSGALDGESWPQSLDITDDGGVWWSAALSIANPQNGISRLEDLNGDDDAADPGEQIVLVDGTGSHLVEHDLGSSSVTTWAMRDIAAAGNGVVAYNSQDYATYRFEDLNGDGDVLDAGESILLLNATGEHAGLPMNPDFADGTLKNLKQQNGYFAFLSYQATAVEDGERAYYFGTTSNGASVSGYTNIDGEGINFLIFRGVDGNGDRDINDAGEVQVYFDGNQINGQPSLLTLRGMDVRDGAVYAAEIKPFPALFPGPDGNVWIHRFEDANADNDALDPGELQLGLFDLQIHGPSPLFPIPPNYGNMMADPWDFSVSPPLPSGSLTYCTAGSSANDCSASLSSTGMASATASSGFDLTATDVEGAKDGLYFFGTNGRQANPWGNGTSYQCVVPPVKRGGLLTGTGTVGSCDGAFTQDLNARWTAKPTQNPGAGAVVQAQLWYRDPFNSSGQTTSLSDAIEFTVQP